jgi:hypothetical protein
LVRLTIDWTIGGWGEGLLFEFSSVVFDLSSTFIGDFVIVRLSSLILTFENRSSSSSSIVDDDDEEWLLLLLVGPSVFYWDI